MADYTNWTDDHLAAEEARMSEEIQSLDNEIAERRAAMRALDIEVNPIRNEIEERKFRKARRDPRTQGVGG